MAKTTDKVLQRAGSARPYLERAFQDEEVRENVKNAFESARSVYNDLLGGRGAIPVATRVATDKEIQERLKEAVDDLREEDHTARNTILLITGIALGILFNPFSGPKTRKWLSDKLFGSSDDFTYQGGNSGAAAPSAGPH
jgi:gas vesicle protein